MDYRYDLSRLVWYCVHTSEVARHQLKHTSAAAARDAISYAADSASAIGSAAAAASRTGGGGTRCAGTTIALRDNGSACC